MRRAKPLSRDARVAIAEVIHLAELAAASKKSALKAFGVLILRRAQNLAEGKVVAAPYRQQDVTAFLTWWTTPARRPRQKKG